MNKGKKVKSDLFQQYLHGSITVEMTYILPLIFMVFLFTIYAIFYYHDKNIIIGAAAEIAVIGAQEERWLSMEKTDLENACRDRMEGKLILLNVTEVSQIKSNQLVRITVKAEKGWMKVVLTQGAVVPYPEKIIRKKRRIESSSDFIMKKEE